MQLISNFVFATLVKEIIIVQSLLVLNPKCYASTKPSSVVEQAVLCRTGRSPQGFPLIFPSFFLFFFLSFFFFTWKLIFILTVRFFYDKLNQLLKHLQDINDGFVFIYFRAGNEVCCVLGRYQSVQVSIGYHLGACHFIICDYCSV